jgi:hypothetical protein
MTGCGTPWLRTEKKPISSHALAISATTCALSSDVPWKNGPTSMSGTGPTAVPPLVVVVVVIVAAAPAPAPAWWRPRSVRRVAGVAPVLHRRRRPAVRARCIAWGLSACRPFTSTMGQECKRLIHDSNGSNVQHSSTASTTVTHSNCKRPSPESRVLEFAQLYGHAENRPLPSPRFPRNELVESNENEASPNYSSTQLFKICSTVQRDRDSFTL